MLILIAFRFDYKKAVNHSERVRLFRLASSCSAFRSRYFMWESGSRVEREFWNRTNARWKSRRICRVCDCGRTFSGQISKLNLFFFFLFMTRNKSYWALSKCTKNVPNAQKYAKSQIVWMEKNSYILLRDFLPFPFLPLSLSGIQ